MGGLEVWVGLRCGRAQRRPAATPAKHSPRLRGLHSRAWQRAAQQAHLLAAPPHALLALQAPPLRLLLIHLLLLLLVALALGLGAARLAAAPAAPVVALAARQRRAAARE